MNSQDPEGFSVPVHRSLIEPLMMGGIPRRLAFINGTAIFSLVMGAQNIWILPFGVLSHIVLAMLYRKDNNIIAIIKANLLKRPFLR